jgi:hypothetical protein
MMHDAKHSSAIELVMVPIPEGRMEFDKKIEAYLPSAFVAGPMRYFGEQGADIRTGEVSYKKNGWFKRDPASVRDFPVWRNPAGEELRVVCSRSVSGLRGRSPGLPSARLLHRGGERTRIPLGPKQGRGLRRSRRSHSLALQRHDPDFRAWHVDGERGYPYRLGACGSGFRQTGTDSGVGVSAGQLKPKIGREKRWISEEWKQRRLAKA